MQHPDESRRLGYLINGGNHFPELVFNIEIPGFSWIDENTWEYKHPRGLMGHYAKQVIGEPARGNEASPIYGVFDLDKDEDVGRMVSFAAHHHSSIELRYRE